MFSRTQAAGGSAPQAPPSAIVTGASGGIGLEIARGLVSQGYHVVLAVRDIAKGEATAKEIGGGEPMRLDVADHASVRTFAQTFLARHERLDLLVNNAGIHTAEWKLSVDGIESTFATNHVGHFLLTHLLLDALKRGAPSRIVTAATGGSEDQDARLPLDARVVNVASEAHRLARRAARSADLRGVGRGQEAPGGWRGITAYAQSKLANIQFTLALARRLEGTGVSAFAVHPGSVRTRWARGPESGLFRFGAALASPFLLSPAKGARTPLHASTSPALDGRTGLYLVRTREATPTALARDVEEQERLWRETEALVGLRDARQAQVER